MSILVLRPINIGLRKVLYNVPSERISHQQTRMAVCTLYRTVWEIQFSKRPAKQKKTCQT